MKTNRPTVNIILTTDKKRPDGTMPYFILVTWRGRAKEKTDYYGTTKTGWRNYPDIRSRVNQIEARIDALMEANVEFTAADCLRPAGGEKQGFLGVLTQLDRDRSESLRALMIEVTGIGKPVSYWTEKVNRQLGYLDFKPKLKY